MNKIKLLRIGTLTVLVSTSMASPLNTEAERIYQGNNESMVVNIENRIESPVRRYESMNPRNLRRVRNPARIQMKMSDEEGLPVVTRRNLDSLVRENVLVPIPRETETYTLNLWSAPDRYSFALDFSRLFLENFAAEYNTAVVGRLNVNSVVRTIENQGAMIRAGNRNAITPRLSDHPRGNGIDISYRRVTREQRMWILGRISELKEMGVIDAVQESNKRIIHVTVLREPFLNYLRTQRQMSPENFQVYLAQTFTSYTNLQQPVRRFAD